MLRCKRRERRETRSPAVLRSGRFIAGLITCLLFLGIAPVEIYASSNRLAEIRGRGALNCGIWPYVPGFAMKHNGRYVGFDVDICRAVAVAILGEDAKVSFMELEHIGQFNERDDVDIVVRRLTWTLHREADTGTTFGPVTFYDGQGFLVTRESGINNISQLAGQPVCVLNIERHPQTLFEFLQEGGHESQLVLVESDEEAETALRSSRCLAYSADASWLAAARSEFPSGPAGYEILPERISKEPLAPLMRSEDSKFTRIVHWTIFVMIAAEELDISSHNLRAVESGASSAQSLLDAYPAISEVALGPGEWAGAIIAAVGNYGEVYERNLGDRSAIRLERGLNRLWTNGGLMYAPPFRK